MRKLLNSAKYPINIPLDVIDDIKSRKLIVSDVIRNALQLTKLEPKYLHEVFCKEENSIYYCIVDKRSDTSVIREMMQLSYFSSRTIGLGEFKIRLVGAFPHMEDAMLAKEFYINKALDKGIYLVNTSGFTRYVSFSMELSRLSKVIKSNDDLSTLVSEVISIIEDSNCRKFSNILDDSLDSIRELVNNRITF